MARDPAEGDAFVFDLVGDDAPADDASATPATGAPGTVHPGSGTEDPAAPSAPDEAATDAGVPPPSDGRGRRRRLAAQLAAALAIVLGTGLAVDGVRDHARMERMRDVPGGVADLSQPLTQAWAWSGTVGPGESSADVAVLGDVLVVESDDGLVALDPATGAVAWTVPLRADADCGPMVPPTSTDPSTPALVCLQGTGADREVVAVGPGGATSASRPLPAADARRHGLPHTGPDGTLLRALRVGPPSAVDPGDARCTAAGECAGTVEAGRDLVLRAEDAATGAERWRVTVPFRPVDATQCTRTFAASWGSSETRLVISGQLAPDAFGAGVTADLVAVQGCGIQAAVTPHGTVLGPWTEPGRGGVTALGTGYAVTRFDGLPRSVLLTADGDVAGEITGYPLAPRVADGSRPATVLGVDEPGRRLRAYDGDGTPRWDIALQSGGQQFLAQVGDTAVVSTGAGTVRGLDLVTGAERWSWDGAAEPSAADGGYFGTAHVFQALTDGETVLLLTEGDSGGTHGLVALDAGTGAVVWQRVGGAAVTTFDPAVGGSGERGVVGGLVAVDGVLLEVTPRGVRGFQ
ncbi:PQQ-binding-like beta-propeller repeat protein [Promicromonospora sp. MS192]|uniref:outer membrane protein assembly factor BamB family protein n=1 Tax=Promicromonospora sp. MS192 TaxID=3412684 RepID=UPI003C2FA6F4